MDLRLRGKVMALETAVVILFGRAFASAEDIETLSKEYLAMFQRIGDLNEEITKEFGADYKEAYIETSKRLIETARALQERAQALDTSGDGR